MKSYTADGYTFTIKELLAGNPCVNSDGSIKEGCVAKLMAFNKAKLEYELEQLSPAEREVRIESTRRFIDRMNS